MKYRPVSVLAAAVLSAGTAFASDAPKNPSQASNPNPAQPAPILLPDLKVGVVPDQPETWPTSFTVTNIGKIKSADEFARVGVFVVGEDPLTKKTCVPPYTGADVLVAGLAPGASKTIPAPPFDATKVKYMPPLPSPNPAPPAPVNGMLACTFQVGIDLANVGKPDANKANDTLTKYIHQQMRVPR